MAAILRVRDEDGNIIEFPAIQGEKGEKGDKGDKGDPGTVDLSNYATKKYVDDAIAAIVNGDEVSY